MVVKKPTGRGIIYRKQVVFSRPWIDHCRLSSESSSRAMTSIDLMYDEDDFIYQAKFGVQHLDLHGKVIDTTVSPPDAEEMEGSCL